MIEGFDMRNNLTPQPGVKNRLAFLPTINGFTVEALFDKGDDPIQQGGIWPPFEEIVVSAHFVFPLLIRPTVRGNDSNPDGWLARALVLPMASGLCGESTLSLPAPLSSTRPLPGRAISRGARTHPPPSVLRAHLSMWAQSSCTDGDASP